jgi:hypothetical protein
MIGWSPLGLLLEEEHERGEDIGVYESERNRTKKYFDDELH